jgi:hypothetical protein
MKTYNGFTHEQRMKSLAWGNKQKKLGLWKAPTQCHACGQTEGTLDLHREDYTEPFHAEDEYPVCYRCHMMIHCREHGMETWKMYKRIIQSGYRFAPIEGRNFMAFWWWFKKPSEWSPTKAIFTPIGKTVFDLIED